MLPCQGEDGESIINIGLALVQREHKALTNVTQHKAESKLALGAMTGLLLQFPEKAIGDQFMAYEVLWVVQRRSGFWGQILAQSRPSTKKPPLLSQHL